MIDRKVIGKRARGIFKRKSESDPVWWYDDVLSTLNTALSEICLRAMLNQQQLTIDGSNLTKLILFSQITSLKSIQYIVGTIFYKCLVN
ncbi:hypothetical protein PL11201_680234 [Planktothrix sp. PCC 11201]|nr:hypothetical protein PL11201_680234 [Planktothrix sp. PCC 11201]